MLSARARTLGDIVRASAGRAAILLTVLAAASPAPSAEPAIPRDPPTLDEWRELSFWHRLGRWKPFQDEHDAVLEFTERVLAGDPGDVIANFLRARAMAAGGADAPEGEAPTGPERPEWWVASATFHELRDEAEEWREDMGRAEEAYRRIGRDDLAFQTLLLRSRFLAGDRSPESEDASLAALREAAEASGDSLRIAQWRLREGTTLYSRNYRESLAPRQEAVRILRGREPGYLLASALNGTGNTLRRLGREEEALRHYREGLQIAEAIGAPDIAADCLLGIGLTLRRLGDPRGALASYVRAREFFDALRDHRRLAILAINLRPLHHQLGEALRARNAAEEAVRLCREHGLDRDLAAALDGFASEEALLGRLDDARRLFEEAIEASQNHGSPGQLVFLWLHLADVLYELEDHEHALDAVASGRKISRDVGNSRGEAFLEMQRAKIELHRGHVDDALAVTTALKDPEREMDDRVRHVVLRTHAQALALSGRRAEAIALLDSLLTGSNADEDPLMFSRTQAQMGLELIAEGREKESIPILQDARQRLLDTHDRSYVHVAGLHLGTALARAGRNEEALRLLEPSLARAEEINSGLTVGEERADHFTRWYEDYHTLARTYVRVGRPEEAFRTLERSRARELRRALNGGRVLTERVDAGTAGEIRRVEAELLSLQSSLVHEYAQEPAERRPDLEAVALRADELKRVRHDILRRIERSSPDLARQTGILPPAELDDLQRRLSPHDLVLATMTSEAGALALEVRRDGIAARELPWDMRALRDLVERAVSEIRGSSTGSKPASRALAAELLVGVHVERPPAVVYVLPDGPLHRLPFEALPVDDDGTLLVEIAEVCYAASATLLTDRLGEPRERTGDGTCDLLAFGDPATDTEPGARSGTRGGLPTLRPLPHARREVHQLGELLGGACVRVGEDATESAFFREAEGARVIHLAAHAYVDDEQPAYSGVVLAAEEGRSEDGIVQAFEVSRADLRAELVTLSACDTGRGPWLRGEGLLGLARAFRIAGARSLVVSLWEVDDAATAELMTDFYRRLLDGKSLGAALREAKLSFLGREPGGEGDATRGVARRTRTDLSLEPGSWASFILVGPGESPYRDRAGR